jgi:hypothetical protein
MLSSSGVIVDDLYTAGAVVSPTKTNSPLSVDPDAVLSASVRGQRFETVAAQTGQIIQRLGTIQNRKSPAS